MNFEVGIVSFLIMMLCCHFSGASIMAQFLTKKKIFSIFSFILISCFLFVLFMEISNG